MRSLSALDASFIYLESDHSPMHIGGVYLMDAASAPAGFGYAAFREHLRQRVRLSPVFRQRLVEVPLGLSHPCWINDPDFDLDRHLPRTRLGVPGGEAELMRLAAQVFGTVLDRARPLWDMLFVEGLDTFPGLAAGSFALISRVHHAAVDGGSGVELMAAVLDATAVPREVPGDDPWRPERLPATRRLVASAYSSLGRKSVELGKLVGEVAAGTARVYGARRARRISPPPRLLSAPASVLNHPVTSSRTYFGMEFDFERIRALRRAVPGATVNDIVLAICGGGLRSYLAGRKALPGRPLVAMAPVSVRTESQRGTAGNQVSAMLVDLGTDESDALRRLQRICASTQGSKIYSSALPANRIAEFIPSETLAVAARLYTRMRIGGRHRPFFNLIITNVPGPQFPLYLAGARITHQFGMAPIIDGLGLIIVVLSYAGKISLGLTSCHRVVPDPGRLAQSLEAALAELEARAHSTGAAVDATLKAPPAPRVRRASDSRSREARSAHDALRRLRDATQELDRAMAMLEEKAGK